MRWIHDEEHSGGCRGRAGVGIKKGGICYEYARQKPEAREHPMTYEDYAALPGEERYELAGGVLELLSPAPTPKHQVIIFQIHRRLVDSRDSEYIIFSSPIDLLLSRTEVRQPDLVMVRRDRIGIITKRGIEGIPDLVAEVLSPHSTKRDRESKLRIYAEHGIPEYWIVDYANESLEQYILSGAAYGIPRVYERDETVRSDRLPCLSLTMAQIVDAAANIPG